MNHLLYVLGVIAVVSTTAIAQEFSDSPDYQKFPVYRIQLDRRPEERFAEVAGDLKLQANQMINDYLHLTPGFLRSFFQDNENVIKMRHLEYYREIVSMANIFGMDTYLLLMLNYAFELKHALCTSIVARQADGKIIHGRNMDFGFADAVRNATYIAKFYKGEEYMFESVMFAGYVGVASAYKPNAFSLTLNARDTDQSVENYFETMGRIFLGENEIGMITRDLMMECADYACMVSMIPQLKTIVPMYFIMAGTGVNEGIVISKGYDQADNIRTIDEENWYLVQTNDDHFAGVCNQRCIDANDHMTAIGEENISMDTLLNGVMLQSHTINVHTIYTTMASPSDDFFKGYGYDINNEYVK